MKTKLIFEFYGQWLKVVIAHSQGVITQVKDIMVEAIDPNLENITGVLGKVIARAGTSKKMEVIVILNRNKITLRKIDLLSKDPREIEQMLSLHVIRQVPYPKEEIVWSYHNLGFDGVNSSSVLLAVAHRDLLRKIFNSFMALKILPEKMLLSSQGIFYYVRDSLKDKTAMQELCLILNVDANSSDLILINKQQLHSSVIISYGAEQLKQDTEIVKFTAELKQALLVFSNDLAQVKAVKLFLSGAGEDIAHLDSHLEKELNLKTEFINSKDYKKFASVTKGMSFSAVLGFAYQSRKEDLCFTLPEIQVKKEIKLKMQQLLVLSVAAAYIFILLGLVVFLKLNQRQMYRDKLSAEVIRLKDKSANLSEMVQKIAVVRQYKGDKQPAVAYLSELNRICPEKIIITNFAWDRQSGMVIRGYAQEMSEIFGFAKTLENTKLFKGVQTRSTRRHKIKNDEVVEFEIGAR